MGKAAQLSVSDVSESPTRHLTFTVRETRPVIKQIYYACLADWISLQPGMD